MLDFEITREVLTTKDDRDLCCDVYIDNNNHIIHIKDNDDEDSYSLTNAVSDEFLEDCVVNFYRRTLNPRVYNIRKFASYRFLLYGTDGIVSEWVNSDFKYCDDESLWYEGFKSAMHERRSLIKY